jgi:hypothetical protein
LRRAFLLLRQSNLAPRLVRTSGAGGPNKILLRFIFQCAILLNTRCGVAKEKLKEKLGAEDDFSGFYG